MPDVIALGEALIDFIALDSPDLSEATSFLKSFGGAPMNTVVGVSRLGVSAGAVTAVGDDPFGEYIVRVLKENFVDTSHIVVKRGLRTPLAFVTNEPETGERKFLFYRGPFVGPTADACLSLQDIDLNYIMGAKILHVSGFALSQSPTRETVLKIVESAREHDVKVFFDPTLRLEVWSSGEEVRKVLFTVLRRCNLAAFSIEEIKYFFEADDPDRAADAILDLGLEVACIRLGSKGALVKTCEGVRVFEPAFKVKAVDTTGAGDGWNAGFIVGTLKGFGLRECVRIANAVGALVVTKRGAITALPSKGELNGFLEDNGIELAV
jgi:sugar/nucleoside kinase (ribokinase family)